MSSVGVEDGLSCSVFFTFTSLPPVQIPLLGYSPTSFKGNTLRGEVMALMAKGTVELASPSPVFCSHLFIIWKTSGLWKHVISYKARLI